MKYNAAISIVFFCFSVSRAQSPLGNQMNSNFNSNNTTLVHNNAFIPARQNPLSNRQLRQKFSPPAGPKPKAPANKTKRSFAVSEKQEFADNNNPILNNEGLSNLNIQQMMSPMENNQNGLSISQGNSGQPELSFTLPKLNLHFSASSRHMKSVSNRRFDFSNPKLHRFLKIEENKFRKMKNHKKKIRVQYERCFEH